MSLSAMSACLRGAPSCARRRLSLPGKKVYIVSCYKPCSRLVINNPICVPDFGSRSSSSRFTRESRNSKFMSGGTSSALVFAFYAALIFGLASVTKAQNDTVQPTLYPNEGLSLSLSLPPPQKFYPFVCSNLIW